MAITLLVVGKRHESWVSDGIDRYERRLRGSWAISWQFIKHSGRDADAARTEESTRLLDRLGDRDLVILLDERGRGLDSPAFARQMQQFLETGRPIVCIIGGAYGVDERVRARADFVWSLSALVFPHQLVRLIVTEQLYRAGEIIAGRGYHHE